MPPRVIVMPGLDGTGLLLRDFAGAMAPHAEVEVLRYPADLARYDDLLPRAAEALPRRGRFVLLAESFSGPLAIRLAAQHPAGLAGVIFITSFACAPLAVPPVLAEPLRALPMGAPLSLAMLEPFCTGKGSAPEVMAAFRAALDEVPPETMAARLRELLAVDERPRLAALGLPHAAVIATGDRLVPARRADELSAGACHTERLDGPHFLMQTRPEAAAKAVAACLAALDAAAPENAA